MTGERLAVIDLGSNTFHLLICEARPNALPVVIFKERIYVKLASGGLDRIDNASVQRAVDAMQRFGEHLRAYDVSRVRAIGTSALREAQNGKTVAQRLSEVSGIVVEIIDGSREAGYILQGIRSCIPAFDRPGLIMDIGGGSVEFILYKGDRIFFKGSYRIGVAVLYRAFHHTDPINTAELELLHQHLDSVLKPLIDVVRKAGTYNLVGASGSFEVIHDVMPVLYAGDHWSELDLRQLEDYLDYIISSNMKVRRQIPEIPIERLDYIVVAYTLIRYIIRQIPPDKLFYCDYALKEGVLEEMLQN